MTSKFSIDNRELLQRISSGEAVVGIDFGNLIVRELAAFRLAAMDSEPDCKERKLFCSTDTARMRKVISVSAGTEDAPLYRHAQPALVVPNGLRLALSNAGIAAPESDEMLAATCEKHIQALVTWVKDRKPFQSAPVVPSFEEWLSAANRKPIGWVKDAMREAYDACRAAMLQTGNSPVIPDGYVMVPKEPTQAMCAAFNDSDYGRKSLRERYVAMLAAAAHDTPALNSVQSVATVPGKWVPVSERMPETDGNYWGWWSESKRQGPVWFIKSELQAQFQSHEITHWMPLPAAPQEVNHG